MQLSSLSSNTQQLPSAKGLSTRNSILMQYHLNQLFTHTYTVFSCLFASLLAFCLFVVCLLFVVCCLFVCCLFVCLFVVEHTDDYSCIAIKTSANQISCH